MIKPIRATWCVISVSKLLIGPYWWKNRQQDGRTDSLSMTHLGFFFRSWISQNCSSLITDICNNQLIVGAAWPSAFGRVDFTRKFWWRKKIPSESYLKRVFFALVRNLVAVCFSLRIKLYRVKCVLDVFAKCTFKKGWKKEHKIFTD